VRRLFTEPGRIRLTATAICSGLSVELGSLMPGCCSIFLERQHIPLWSKPSAAKLRGFRSLFVGGPC